MKNLRKTNILATIMMLVVLIASASFVSMAEGQNGTDVVDNPTLSVASYDMTDSGTRCAGGRFTVNFTNGYDMSELSYGCVNMTAIKGDAFTVTAYPDNGFRFVGWYLGNYLSTDDQGNPIQAAEPILDDEHILTENRTYSAQIESNYVLCAVFEQAPLVNFVDIGNVWTTLDPFHEFVFTGEINPNEDGLSDFITIGDETWANEDGSSVISLSDANSDVPVVNNTYKYTATISAKGNNEFDAENGFRFVYGGTEYGPDDYIVSFSENRKTAFISGFISDIKIEPIDISSATISGIADRTYNGKVQTQSPTVKVDVNGDTITLTNGSDYNLSYKNNKNAGTATLTIAGNGAVTGSVNKTFNINAKKITPSVTLSAKSYTYNGKVKKPAVTVKVGSTKISSSNYTVSYAKGRKNVGVYKVTVKMKGNYSGSKTVSFKINPKGTSIAKLVKGNKLFTVKWNKQAGKMSAKNISGYQIQYSKNSKFKSGNKTVNVSGYKNTSKKITGLKAKTKYYVRVRTYMKVGGTTLYSGWSKAKAVTTAAPVAKKSAATSSGTVYWTPSGSVYHLSSGCRTLSRSRTVYSGSISESGKPRVCKVCGN